MSTKKNEHTHRYSKGAQDIIAKEMHAFKHGQAHSGLQKQPVESRKQAIAIGISEARKAGKKVPKKPKK